jgi:CelD/BcsL family acetyltransferase involved in cellulose biosynthesis
MASVEYPTRRPAGALRRGLEYLGQGLQLLTPLFPRLFPVGSGPVRELRAGDLLLQCQRHAQCPKLAQAWAELHSRVSSLPFQSPHWMRPLLLHAERMGQLRLISVYRDGHLIAVIPSSLNWRGTLTNIGQRMSDYLDPLIDPAYEEHALREVLIHIDQLVASSVRRIVFVNQSAEFIARCPSGVLVREVSFSAVDEVVEPVARIALTASWDEFLATLAAHDRREIRRKLRKAESRGGAVLECCRDELRLKAELQSIFKLMTQQGGAKARKARWMFPHHFAAAAVPMFREGRMRVYRLIIQNQHAAGLISFPTPVGEIFWTVTFDRNLKQWSPGIVIFAMLIRQAISRGDKSIDLLRGGQSYKHDLGGVDYPLYRRTFDRLH